MEDSHHRAVIQPNKVKSLGRAILLCLFALTLSACTQKFKDLGATFDNALFGEKDVVLDASDLASSPYASVYARVNDGRQIHMVLAFAEHDPETGARLLKWMSADRAMIVTSGGRIVKTLALPDTNLAGIQGAPDRVGRSLGMNLVYDWQPGYRFGYAASVRVSKQAEESIVTPLRRVETEHILERIDFKELDRQIENHYWLDEEGRVIKTIQYLGPDMHKVELLLIKDFSG